MMRVSQNGALPGYSNRLALNMPPRSSYRWQTKICCSLRGRYKMRPLTLEATDPFGVFSVQKSLGNGQSVLVYPAVKELSVTPITLRGEVPAYQCWLTSTPGGVISRVREYTRGDSLNHIHWPSTAHTGQLMVKDFSQDRTRGIWIITDMSKASSLHDKTGQDIERRISISASITKHFMERGYSVGLITEGDNLLVLPTGFGESHYWSIMEALALVKADGRLSIDELIRRKYKDFNKGTLVFIVAASVTPGLVTQILRMDRRGSAVLLMIPRGTALDGDLSYRRLRRCLAPSGIPAYLVE